MNVKSCLLLFGFCVGLFALAKSEVLADRVWAPHIAGTWRVAGHPRVFMTKADLISVAARAQEQNSFTAKMYARLSAEVKMDLASGVDWSASYSGCELNVYLRLFSYEPTGGYANSILSDEQLRAAAHVSEGAVAPRGAAIVAARLALYAAIQNAGAPVLPDMPAAADAIAVAKTILQSWAAKGFRAENGAFLSSPSQFCIDGKPDRAAETSVGLQVSRGMVYFVEAQDLLLGLNALDKDSARQLDAFQAAMFTLIRNGHNFAISSKSAWHHDCERYSNHIASQLTGLLAIARLSGDEAGFMAVLRGGGGGDTLALPLEPFINFAIYGKDQDPNECYANSGQTAATSHPSFSTPTTIPGEIDDRNRNATPAQGIGYPMGTLQWLYRSAEILKIAGFEPYAYRGAHGQSIEQATQFYACYAKGAGFKKIVTIENAGACPNFVQYDGRVVEAAGPNIVIGAWRFPADLTIVNLEAAAKAAAAVQLTDPLLFGRWND